MDDGAEPPESVTRMLREWSGGDREALNRLIPIVYDELRRIAHRCLDRERDGHTLSTTGVVHEAYLKLQRQQGVVCENRTHFYAIAARSMRQILVDYARKLATSKREHERAGLTVEVPDVSRVTGLVDLIALHDALNELESFDSRQSQIVELRFFAGMSIEEAAEVLDLSPATLKREWTIARAWLFQQIGGGVAFRHPSDAGDE
jgi:RNA polymerase sigma factor (TIGR02999 family)